MLPGIIRGKLAAEAMSTKASGRTDGTSLEMDSINNAAVMKEDDVKSPISKARYMEYLVFVVKLLPSSLDHVSDILVLVTLFRARLFNLFWLGLAIDLLPGNITEAEGNWTATDIKTAPRPGRRRSRCRLSVPQARLWLEELVARMPPDQRLPPLLPLHIKVRNAVEKWQGLFLQRSGLLARLPRSPRVAHADDLHVDAHLPRHPTHAISEVTVDSAQRFRRHHRLILCANPLGGLLVPLGDRQHGQSQPRDRRRRIADVPLQAQVVLAHLPGHQCHIQAASLDRAMFVLGSVLRYRSDRSSRRQSRRLLLDQPVCYSRRRPNVGFRLFDCLPEHWTEVHYSGT